MGDKVFICRCEDITLEEIEQAIDEGYTTIEELKCRLRLGMGPCQGRGCLLLAKRVLSKKTGKTYSEIKMPTTRPPLIPVSLGVLASDKKNKK
ncbi:MAG: (2Fe-2S)-binding protein [Thermoplasmata archaeon]|nr:MAG: (2Fe-2S)-binding protein [Thermoplasmata archaeon]RLF34895.1 MAG: (2Fe-2S)-binding protein [Thermoplasmata archaeon]